MSADFVDIETGKVVSDKRLASLHWLKRCAAWGDGLVVKGWQAQELLDGIRELEKRIAELEKERVIWMKEVDRQAGRIHELEAIRRDFVEQTRIIEVDARVLLMRLWNQIDDLPDIGDIGPAIAVLDEVMTVLGFSDDCLPDELEARPPYEIGAG